VPFLLSAVRQLLVSGPIGRIWRKNGGGRFIYFCTHVSSFSVCAGKYLVVKSVGEQFNFSVCSGRMDQKEAAKLNGNPLCSLSPPTTATNSSPQTVPDTELGLGQQKQNNQKIESKAVNESSGHQPRDFLGCCEVSVSFWG
jgi:hypothetical protein